MKNINPVIDTSRQLIGTIKYQATSLHAYPKRAREFSDKLAGSLIKLRSNRIITLDEVDALAYIMNEATLDDGTATVGSDKDIMYIGNLDVRVLAKHMIWRKP